MVKKNKLKTPDWIVEGYDSPEAYSKAKGVSKKKKGKIFYLKKCPKCDSDNIGVVVGKESKGEWECYKCKWKGMDVKKEELSEDEFMKYLDEKGEEVA